MRNIFAGLVTMLFILGTIGSVHAANPMISASLKHTIALKDDGTVWAWGANSSGQLGNGTTTNSIMAVPVSHLTGVSYISTNTNHSLALKSDGTVWAWGSNNYGELGDSIIRSSLTPVQVIGLSEIISVAAGTNHSVALKSDGTVWTWGRNVGDGTNETRYTPVEVNDISDIVAIAAGSGHTLALKSDGAVWAWGENGKGQLGDGTTENKLSPVQVWSGLSDVAKIKAQEECSLAFKADGTLWVWGSQAEQKLGFGISASSTVPLKIPDISDVMDAVCLVDFMMIIKSDGTVWGLGQNGSGQFGNGGTQRSDIFVLGPDISDFMNIYGSSVSIADHTVAIKSDGTVWAWGNDSYEQLGNGTDGGSLVPVQVVDIYDPSGFFNIKVSDIAPITETECTEQGNYWCDEACRVHPCPVDTAKYYEEGKQFCINNPEECGISTGGDYSQAELDAARQEGYDTGFTAGQADCPGTGTGECEDASLSAGLKFHLPEVLYIPLNGAPLKMWADLEFHAEENGMYLWKLGEFGQK